ncbi:hypothetical protein P154DRAFT_537972 [Amniculicola lignicola CBS 123094]|uniref:Zinc finger PHD-type domain-containing protein n=1 Tax=Amniculicola lignicola CBS 123094 TaxID=1392246 RepID=A0A6A5W3J8_9PLEO|nr:hypothetical protein P154DRAFT_537972 [Amniculicola lignicola CBS 123094]
MADPNAPPHQPGPLQELTSLSKEQHETLTKAQAVLKRMHTILQERLDTAKKMQDEGTHYLTGDEAMRILDPTLSFLAGKDLGLVSGVLNTTESKLIHEMANESGQGKPKHSEGEDQMASEPGASNVIVGASRQGGGEQIEASGLEAVAGSDESSILWCTCRRLQTDRMISCDNAGCRYKRFHLWCVNMKSTRQAGNGWLWLCPGCRELSKDTITLRE